MLDTITYIPTILAYAFIALLFAILCFIVIYIGHNIVATIYANFPVPAAALYEPRHSDDDGSSIDTLESPRRQSPSVLKHLNDDDNPFLTRKSKTALRIIVTVEPSYLAYVIFAYAIAGEITHESARGTIPGSLHYNKLVKFFDRLSDIPFGKIMETCPPPTQKSTQPHEFRLSDTLSTVAPTRQTRIITDTHRPTMVTFNALLDGVVQNARKSEFRPVRRVTHAPKHLTYSDRESRGTLMLGPSTQTPEARQNTEPADGDD